ncbi:hypothetical protein B0H14DRAFT_2593071 [Mycena olivaceomarginata]|nr:hypothetical protein B0H14DRAFT_2593071 [Mycena olivaceomarginata]
MYTYAKKMGLVPGNLGGSSYEPRRLLGLLILAQPGRGKRNRDKTSRKKERKKKVPEPTNAPLLCGAASSTRVGADTGNMLAMHGGEKEKVERGAGARGARAFLVASPPTSWLSIHPPLARSSFRPPSNPCNESERGAVGERKRAEGRMRRCMCMRSGRKERGETSANIVKRGAPIAISTIGSRIQYQHTQSHTPIPHAMAYPNIPLLLHAALPLFPCNPAQKKRQKRPPGIPLYPAARPMKIKHKGGGSTTLSRFAHDASHLPCPPIFIAQDERDMMQCARMHHVAAGRQCLQPRYDGSGTGTTIRIEGIPAPDGCPSAVKREVWEREQDAPARADSSRLICARERRIDEPIEKKRAEARKRHGPATRAVPRLSPLRLITDSTRAGTEMRRVTDVPHAAVKPPDWLGEAGKGRPPTLSPSSPPVAATPGKSLNLIYVEHDATDRVVHLLAPSQADTEKVAQRRLNFSEAHPSRT